MRLASGGLSILLTVLTNVGCGPAVDAIAVSVAERPQVLWGLRFSADLDTESTARAFLISRATEFHLDTKGSTLVLQATREGQAGHYLRFAQHQDVEGVARPVFGAEVVVLVHDDGHHREVRAVNLAHQDRAWEVRPEGDVGAAQALALASAAVPAEPPSAEPETTLGVFMIPEGPRLAWRVHLAMEQAPQPHDWHVFVDAATGAVLARRDRVANATGEGYVYDLSAVASSGDLTLKDVNNVSTPALDAARFRVQLPNLDSSGFLRGTWANVSSRVNRASSPTGEFLFQRDNLGFEQTNTYFHLDRAQQRLQALGFTSVNNRMQDATVDAQPSDNSYYLPTSRQLSFGTGGVDDAEDGDIVTHEYGHSIQHDQVPGFNQGGNAGALGEGFGDYLAAAFSVSLSSAAGHQQRADPACVGDWDATSYATTTPACLRRVDGTKHYPEAEEGEDHADGELWSAALWDLRGQLGANLTDTVVLEAQFLMSTSSTFFAAAQTVLAADAALNNGAHEASIRRTFIAYGLTRQLSAPATGGPLISLPVSLSPVWDLNGLYRDSTDELATLRVPGATAVAVHFSRLDLERNSGCLNMNCDNLYLSNPAGDLFQVLGGASQNVTSVLVPGDTVRLRLVSDRSARASGYTVDRVEVLGTPDGGVEGGLTPDGGRLDGGVDAGRPDAGLPAGDAGVRDAGLDAGFSEDAGQPPLPPDAGVADAGVRTKAFPALGTQSLAPAADRGCGCGSTPGLEVLGMMGVLAWWRRRPRTSPCASGS